MKQNNQSLGNEANPGQTYQEPNIPKALLSPYNPETTELVVIDIESNSKLANPDECIKAGLTTEEAPHFSIILPPPNVTGTLHLGHGLMATLQDISIRFERMRGKRTLWIPGTDHAAIATQSKVEKEISKKEGKSRYDLGREELLRRIEEYAKNSHDTIVSQVKRLGASCDWSREAYTLDEKRNKAVRTMFKKMYEDGLIYQGNRLVNWDPKGQTTISDDEIVYEERQATMYTFRYSKDFPIAISSTRPETKIGDVAVAVHPDDERYAEFVGKTYTADFCGSKIEIKIVADKEVEMEFGTGAVGVTPAHSMIDAEIAKRHDLPMKQVIDEKARMMVGLDSPLYDAEKNIGMKTSDAREKVAAWLREQGLMEKEEAITQRVSTAERTGAIIEPLPKTQWWVAVNKPFKIKKSLINDISSGQEVTLKQVMRNAVSEGQVSILPDHYNKTYFHWIDNLNDWCISRQIWYGHRIPVWYKKDAEGQILETHCDIEAPAGNGWVQDEDTLDTWFSSGLWTFSTMGWPEAYSEETGTADAISDLARFHPTSLLVTGPDILFFWVARMILMTGYALGEVPFNTVYINGIVRDAQGRKMSKSLNNGGDPIEISNKYGADALRMFYAMSTAPGTDSKLLEDKIKGFKHFGNKIWNITRFVLTSLETAGTDGSKIAFDPHFTAWSSKDVALIAERDEVMRAATKELGEYKYHLAAEKPYHYTWSTFADIILEDSKKMFNGLADADGFFPNQDQKNSRAQFLLHTLRMLLVMIHPMMPHVTEELWSLLNSGQSLTERDRATIRSTELLMAQKWPY